MKNALKCWNVYSGIIGGGGGQEAECPTDTFDQVISAGLLGKEKQGKKAKWRRKEGKLKKGRLENWKWKEEKLQDEEWTIFFFFFFF